MGARPKILVTSADWKESMGPTEANQIITEVLQTCLPQAHIQSWPLSDGGDGWLEVVRHLPLGRDCLEKKAQVIGPHPKTWVEATYLWSPSQKTAYIEAAEIHGMRRLSMGEKIPLEATSYGIGQLLLHLQNHHPEICQAVVSVGGSASVDGGAGCLQALGWRFIDNQGNVIQEPIGGKYLPDLSQIEPPHQGPLPFEVLAVVDVHTLYLEAPAVFGPQKGATPEEVHFLEKGFRQVKSVIGSWAQAMTFAGSGAAGGLAFALRLSSHQGQIILGTQWFMTATDLFNQWTHWDIVITGEGQFDETSYLGKATGFLVEKAIESHHPLVLFCGKNQAIKPLPPWVQIYPLYRPDEPIDPCALLKGPKRLSEAVRGALPAIVQMLAWQRGDN